VLRDEALKKFKKAQKVEVFIKKIQTDRRIDFTLVKPEKKKLEQASIVNHTNK
jgi:hypothetical protein